MFLTIVFFTLAELLIYIPSVANFWNTWLQERLDSASLASLVDSAAPGMEIPPELERRMLDMIGVEGIASFADNRSWVMGQDNLSADVVAEYDLPLVTPLNSMMAAVSTLFSSGDQLMIVRGQPPAGHERFEIILRRSELRDAMLVYSRHILVLSLIISAVTGILIYLALQQIIVRPMQRLTDRIIAFSSAPEEGRVEQPSGRRDEIGLAEERFVEMQSALRQTLSERRHLASLGLAVSKINHDLRNILAPAQLFSDRLSSAQDPVARRFAPKVVRAIDRAIGYTSTVMAYGQAREEEPNRHLLSLSRLAEDAADVIGLTSQSRITWDNNVSPDLEIDADPEQFFRVLMNLLRNAADALESGDDPAVIRRIWIEGERQAGIVTFRICDTGPGVPPRAKERLFEPFHGSVRPGGTGLGLPIAAEIVRAHDGRIALIERQGAGAVFEVTIPDRAVRTEQRRAVNRSAKEAF
ncbi:signal transduction histidine kinase /histidine kinase [Faunimonas pinastri]|uniref:histidine kinase n=1 Tax=Faunimonas pinastri TaxID=1855383 RepID=A0A1H9HD69_9HYPH|nr:signal transduction histidine kinase /histidine kinase [Faunimonas pinastri]